MEFTCYTRVNNKDDVTDVDDDIPKSEVVARLIESDPHQWSDRPCQTCRQVTAILERNFGCYNKTLRRH